MYALRKVGRKTKVKKLREKLNRKTNRAREKLNRKTYKLREKLNRKTNKAREKLNRKTNRAREKFDYKINEVGKPKLYAIFSKSVPAKYKYKVPNFKRIKKFTSRKEAEKYRRKYLREDSKVLRV